jgi:integrase/recombinase XerD
MNIYQATDLYLAEAARQGKSPRTRDRYRRHFEKLGDMYPHYDVDEVTTVMIRRFLDQWQNAAPATSAQIISMLRAFFGWLAREGIIPADPTERLERPRLPRPEEQDHLTSLSTVEVQRMLAATSGWPERIALHLLAYTGARRGAVAQLHRRDYDPETGEVTFREKGGKTIVKPIPTELRYILDAAIASGLYSDPGDYLVPPENRLRRAGPRDDKIIWKLVKRVAARVGIDAHVHAFRAAFAVYFLETKPDKLIALQSLLGHSNLETTRIYLRRLDRRKAMEEVRDLSWGAAPVSMLQVLPVAEKEGFEPSLDDPRGPEPKGTPPDGDAA